MIVLAIDTCFNRCAACLYDAASKHVLAAEQLEMERGHAEALAPMVQRILAKAGVVVSDVSRLAVTTGPGTFTGLRIGLSFARAFALARNIPAIGLDSLHAVALAVRPDEGPALIAHRAGQSGFHYVLRDINFDHLEILKEDDLLVMLKDWRGLLLGTAADELYAQAKSNVLQRDKLRDLPNLEYLAAFAAAATPTRVMPEPVYLREADAKPQLAAQFLVRPSGSVDLAAMAKLHQASFSRGWNEADIASILSVAGTTALVVEGDGAMAGFIVIRSVLGEGEILTLAVSTIQRKRGFGKSLLGAALNAAQGNSVRKVFLEVSANNVAALALYKSFNFAETGRRKGYYSNASGPEDAVLMARALP